MNDKLLFLIVFSSVVVAKGELEPYVNYLKGISERLAQEKCTSECHEKKEGCREYRNHLALCESLKEKIYEENYTTCFCNCKNDNPPETSVVCSYHCIRSTYKMEKVEVPDNFFNSFIDSLSEQESNICAKGKNSS